MKKIILFCILLMSMTPIVYGVPTTTGFEIGDQKAIWNTSQGGLLATGFNLSCNNIVDADHDVCLGDGGGGGDVNGSDIAPASIILNGSRVEDWSQINLTGEAGGNISSITGGDMIIVIGTADVTISVNLTELNSSVNSSIDLRVDSLFLTSILDSIYVRIDNLATAIDNATIIRSGVNESWIQENQNVNSSTDMEKAINKSGSFYNISIPCSLISQDGGGGDSDFCNDATGGGGADSDWSSSDNVSTSNTSIVNATFLTSDFEINITQTNINMSGSINALQGWFVDIFLDGINIVNRFFNITQINTLLLDINNSIPSHDQDLNTTDGVTFDNVTITGKNTGDVLASEYDLIIGQEYGAIRLGNSAIFKGDVNAGGLNINGSMAYRNLADGDSMIEHIFITSNNEVRLAIPIAGDNLAMNLIKSVVIRDIGYNDQTINCTRLGYNNESNAPFTIDCNTGTSPSGNIFGGANNTGSDFAVPDDILVGHNLLVWGQIISQNWSNVSIGESQIIDLTHIGNETPFVNALKGNCSSNQVMKGVLGNGTANCVQDNNTVYTDAEARSAVNGSDINASAMTLARLDGSTFSTVQDLQNIYHSTGWVSGGNITTNNTIINISGGTGLIRSLDTRTTDILYFDWPAVTNQEIPANTTRYVGIEYNAGSPQVVIKTTDTWDYQTDFPLGTVVNEITGIHILPNPQAIGDHAAFMIIRSYETMPFARDARTGGLIIGTNGLNVTMTAGTLWDRLNNFPITSKDTGGSDTMDRYYRDGSGGFVVEQGVIEWNNSKYDDGSGTLATISNNRYAVQWFYIDVDDELVSVYGTAEYLTQAGAEDEGVPTSIPDRLSKHGKLIGRIIFQEGGTTALSIESVFTVTFAGAVITDHGELAGLDDPADHAWAALIDGTRDLAKATITGDLSSSSMNETIGTLMSNETIQKNITRQFCSSTDKFSGIDNGVFTCTADEEGAGGGGGGDKWLDNGNYMSPNTSFAPTVNASTLTADFGTNITKAGIIATGTINASAFYANGVLVQAITDTNFSTACSDGEYGDGSGICININNSIDEGSNYTSANGNITILNKVITLIAVNLAEMDNSVSAFITNAVSDLTNYFTKTEINAQHTDINNSIVSHAEINESVVPNQLQGLNVTTQAGGDVSGVFASLSVETTGGLSGENITSGTVGESFIDSTIARDSEIIGNCSGTNSCSGIIYFGNVTWITGNQLEGLNVTTQFGGDVSGTFDAIAVETTQGLSFTNITDAPYTSNNTDLRALEINATETITAYNNLAFNNTCTIFANSTPCMVMTCPSGSTLAVC